MAPQPSRFSFDATSHRYRDTRSGRFVPAASVRSALDTVLDGSKTSMRGLTENLQRGEVTLAEWQSRAADAIRQAHVAAGVAARGGFAQTSQADYGFIGSQIKKQYQRLREFADQLATGREPLQGGRVVQRAEMYAESARSTERAMQTRIAKQGGADEEKSELGEADHCDLCLSEAARGWVEIGTLIPVGSRTCLTRCRCVVETRNKAQQAEAAA